MFVSGSRRVVSLQMNHALQPTSCLRASVCLSGPVGPARIAARAATPGPGSSGPRAIQPPCKHEKQIRSFNTNSYEFPFKGALRGFSFQDFKHTFLLVLNTARGNEPRNPLKENHRGWFYRGHSNSFPTEHQQVFCATKLLGDLEAKDHGVALGPGVCHHVWRPIGHLDVDNQGWEPESATRNMKQAFGSIKDLVAKEHVQIVSQSKIIGFGRDTSRHLCLGC